MGCQRGDFAPGLGPGRTPLSYRAAWSIIAAAEEDPAEARRIQDTMASSPSERSLARKRLAELRNSEQVEDLLRPWLANRAERRVYRGNAT